MKPGMVQSEISSIIGRLKNDVATSTKRVVSIAQISYPLDLRSFRKRSYAVCAVRQRSQRQSCFT